MSRYDNIVSLISRSIDSEDGISKLIKEQQTGKEWNIILNSSSPESTAVIINNLNKCTVRRLEISDIILDSKCVSMLSETLKTNKTMSELWLHSSLLTADGIKQIIEVLYFNNTLKVLRMWHIPITDEDTTYLSNMLTTNIALEKLTLFNCNITDNGVRYICEGLVKNQTLTKLNISGNLWITSVSTSTIVKLMETTTSLTELRLDNTSLNDYDIETICIMLAKNTTIQELYLSKHNKNRYEKLDSYQSIKERIIFW